MVKTPRTREPKRGAATVDLDPAMSPPTGTETVVDSAAPDGPAAVESAASPVEPERVDPIDTVITSDVREPPHTETGSAAPFDQEYRAAEEAEQPAVVPRQAPGFDRAGPVAAQPALASRSDGLSRIVAGLVGALVALAAVFVAQFAGLLGSPGGSSADTEAIRQLQQEVASLRAAPAPAEDPRVADLSSAVESVRTELGALRQSAQTDGGERLDAAETKLAALEQTVSGLASSGSVDPATISALGERVAAAETLAKSAGDAASGTEGRLAALEQTVSGLTGRVEAQAQQPKIAMAIATAALKSAVERGSPFLAELETFAAVAPDAPEIGGLRAHAETGIVTREALAAAFEPAASSMLAASQPADPNAGYLDRLISSAESLVSVRPVGDVSGSGVPETLARIESALEAGDLPKANAEFDSLPEPVRAAGGDFGARLKARLDVETLVDQAIASAMKS